MGKRRGQCGHEIMLSNIWHEATGAALGAGRLRRGEMRDERVKGSEEGA